MDPRAAVSADEVARFNALAAEWWDPDGPMRPLHRMNPARIGWITERIARKNPAAAGLRVLDVGCGAGLGAEARPVAASMCSGWTQPARRSMRLARMRQAGTCRLPTARASPRTFWPKGCAFLSSRRSR